MLIIWCSGISLCQAWHWLKIEDWILFQWQFESVTHFHSGFKVTEGKWKVPFPVVRFFHYRLEVWLADLLYSLSCIHEMGHTNWYEVIWILEFPGQSLNKTTDNFSHLEQDSHWLNHFIWVLFKFEFVVFDLFFVCLFFNSDSFFLGIYLPKMWLRVHRGSNRRFQVSQILLWVFP